MWSFCFVKTIPIFHSRFFSLLFRQSYIFHSSFFFLLFRQSIRLSVFSLTFPSHLSSFEPFLFHQNSSTFVFLFSPPFCIIFFQVFAFILELLFSSMTACLLRFSFLIADFSFCLFLSLLFRSFFLPFFCDNGYGRNAICEYMALGWEQKTHWDALWAYKGLREKERKKNKEKESWHERVGESKKSVPHT